MADEAPQILRQADANIYKAATRAAQLQSVKPIIAYWCEYWVLKQILSKGLHTSYPDILEYSTHLMDKLEQAKTQYATEEALTDDAAGQAYVEQFAQETLDRAQRVVRANKVTPQTANTFDAAATFFSLVNIWGTPDQENLQKIKYAKWNAMRILKALKEGKDPNESNPKEADLPAQDAADSPEHSLGGSAQSPDIRPTGPRPVTIEDEPDRELQPSQLRRDSAGISLPHSPASVASSRVAQQPDDKPLDASAPPSAPQAWVPTPSPPADQPAFLPPPPTETPAILPSAPQSRPSIDDPDIVTPDSFYQPQPPQPPQPPQAPPTFTAPFNTAPPISPSYTPAAPVAPPAPPVIPTAPPVIPAAPVVPAAYVPREQPPAPSAVTGFPPTTYRAASPSAPAPAAAVDDLAMAGAQKHAKWAISALNFEDVPTAIRELRKALELLGTS